MGLVELPIYGMPSRDRLVAPRVLARTHLVARNVVAVPDGCMVGAEDGGSVAEIDPDRAVLAELQRVGVTLYQVKRAGGNWGSGAAVANRR